MLIKNPLKYLNVILIILISSMLTVLLFFIIFFGTEYVESEGLIKPSDYQLVSSKISGVIKKVYFKDGDNVKAGDLLLEYESTDLEYELKNNELERDKLQNLIMAQMKSRKNNSQKNEIIKKKIEEMNKVLDFNLTNKFISQKEYIYGIYDNQIKNIEDSNSLLRTDTELNTQINNLKLLDLKISNLNDQILNCKIYAKINGIIIEDDDTLKEGRYYPAGTPIEIVFSDDHIFAELQIPENKISKIEVGQQVKLYINSLPYTKFKVYNGKLTSLKKTSFFLTNKDDPSANKYYIGKVEIVNPYYIFKKTDSIEIKRLIFGMTLRAKIQVGRINLLKKFYNID